MRPFVIVLITLGVGLSSIMADGAERHNIILVMPDDVPAHPHAVAMETAMLAPKAELSMYPWKEPKELIPLAVRQVRSFLKAHRPATA